MIARRPCDGEELRRSHGVKERALSEPQPSRGIILKGLRRGRLQRRSGDKEYVSG